MGNLLIWRDASPKLLKRTKIFGVEFAIFSIEKAWTGTSNKTNTQVPFYNLKIFKTTKQDIQF